MTRTATGSPICRDAGHGRLAEVARSFKADVYRYLNKSPENRAAGVTFKSVLSAILTNQLQCMLLYRLTHYLHVNGLGRCGLAVSRLNYYLNKITLPPATCIGAGCFIPHPVGVTFYGSAGAGLTLYHLAVSCASLAAGEGSPGVAWLGDRVVIGGRAVLLGPARVGDETRLFATPLRQDAPSRKIVVCGRPRQHFRAAQPS